MNRTLRRAMILLAVLACEASAPAHAEPVPCAALSEMLQQLAQKYHEAPLFYGVGADGADIIITADPSGKTWTALVGDASGNVCIAAIGPNWRSIIADVSFDQEG
jgi:20S proteasome alpha/beta subunit